MTDTNGGSILPFKTKEDILKNVRNKRTNTTGRNESTDSTSIRTNEDTPDTSIRDDRKGQGNAQSVYGRNGTNTDTSGSIDGNNDDARQSSREVARRYSSIDNSSRRNDASTSKQVRRSIFSVFNGVASQKPTSTPKKQEKKEETKKLTELEATKLRQSLIDILRWQSKHADEFIIATTKGHDMTIIIWSNMDDEDIEVLADVMIARAKRSAKAAKIVRDLVSLQEKLKVAVIVAPRLWKTIQTYIAKGIGIG